ncbi:MAG TPA: hypothetical protein VET25_02955 [Aestuariivirgaceae bacterium]|nr:hypothetical protein [Aestuariivirgaceae bacterium]
MNSIASGATSSAALLGKPAAVPGAALQGRNYLVAGVHPDRAGFQPNGKLLDFDFSPCYIQAHLLAFVRSALQVETILS